MRSSELAKYLNITGILLTVTATTFPVNATQQSSIQR